MSEKEKIVASVIGAEVVGCLVVCSWCYAAAQYYRGYLDAKKDASRQINKLKKKLEKKSRRFGRKIEL